MLLVVVLISFSLLNKALEKIMVKGGEGYFVSVSGILVHSGSLDPMQNVLERPQGPQKASQGPVSQSASVGAETAADG